MEDPIVLVDELDRYFSRFRFRIDGYFGEIEIFRQEEFITSRRAVADPIELRGKRPGSDIFETATLGDFGNCRIVQIAAEKNYPGDFFAAICRSSSARSCG